MTIASVRIVAWPSPQSSVQMTGYVPILSGVMCSCVWRPGTVSCFCPNSGTQNEWITSSALNAELDGAVRPAAAGRRVVRLFASGY